MSKKLVYSLLTGLLTIGVLTACGEVEEDPSMDDGGGMQEDSGME